MTKNTRSNKHTSRFCFTHVLLFLSYCICITILYFTPMFYEDYDFCLRYANNTPASSQLFYDIGEGFSEAQSITVDCEDKRAIFPLEDNIRNRAIAYRFDINPGKTNISFSLDSLSILLNGKEIKTYRGKELKELFSSTNHISEVQVKDNRVLLSIIDTDPFFVLKDHFIDTIPNHVEKYNNQIRILYFLYITITVLSLSVLICFRGFFISIIQQCPPLLMNAIGAERLSALQKKYFCYGQKLSLQRKLAYIISVLLILSAVLLHSVGRFLLDYFSGLSMAEIIFHLKVPMAGTDTSMILRYFEATKTQFVVSGSILAAIVIILALKKNIRNCKGTSTIALALSLCLFLLSILSTSRELNLPEYIANQMKTSSFIEEHYVMPENTSVKFPEAKRNLIYIYVESMESTFISKQEGGCMSENLIPELTQMAKEHINFSENDMMGGATSSDGTTWTVGAMVAATCGLPLLTPIDGNSYGVYSEFLPGAISLGEILKDNGYTQEIMVGSDLSFGGRRNYFTQHGDYKVYDLLTARNREDLPDDYHNGWWGFEDSKLFSYAKEEIAKLAKGAKPFNFTMLTVDTHHIGGYLCELCDNKHETQYENVLSCSSRQTASFVNWLKEQDFYENTTIIISGDHPTMDAQYMGSHYDNSKPRKVYNCFINAIGDDSNSKNRDFNTFDMFPTTLAAMGCEISEDRLGLGTNLFSGKKTLAETYGYEKINAEFAMRSTFYEKHILKE